MQLRLLLYIFLGAGFSASALASEYIEIAASDVRIRQTPNGEQVGLVYNDSDHSKEVTKFQVIEGSSQKGWTHILYKGKSAYVFTKFTKRVKGSKLESRQKPKESAATDPMEASISCLTGNCKGVRRGAPSAISIPLGGTSSGWLSPIANHQCHVGSRGFGMHRHPIFGNMRMHKGQDIQAARGTILVAPQTGIVEYAGFDGGLGYHVRLKIGAYTVTYAHMKFIPKGIRNGVVVRRGQSVGAVGATGFATGPHLHLQMTKNGKLINPLSKYSRKELCG